MFVSINCNDFQMLCIILLKRLVLVANHFAVRVVVFLCCMVLWVGCFKVRFN